MMLRIGIVGIVVLSSMVVLKAAEPEQKSSAVSDSPTAVTAEVTADQTKEKGGLELTIEELAAFNGKAGKPIYVAVEGIIYDVSDTKAWKKGRHKGHNAGTDITELIKKKSPHGIKILKKRKVVGRIISSPKK